MTDKIPWLLLTGFIILTSLCLFADAGMFLVPWPANVWVMAFAFLLFFPGAILFVTGAIRSRKTLKPLVTHGKGVSLAVLAVTGAILLYLNLRPRVWTAPHIFKDDPIIVTTARGWPLPLSLKEHITQFEYVESLRFGEPQPGSRFRSARMQREFSQEGFVDKSFVWPVNILHWFLVLFRVFIIAYWARMFWANRTRPTAAKPAPI